MRRKITAFISVSLLSASVSAFAVGCPTTNSLFAVAEGGYTWTSLNNSVFNGVTTGQTKSGGTGRIGAGAVHWACPNIGFSGEAGWGYYDYTKFNSTVSGNASNQTFGFDMLLGGIYRIDHFDLALKVGAMWQNVRMVRNSNLAALIGGNVVTGSDKSTSTVSSVLPLIKVSGAYNFNQNWALSLAYQHAFGNNNVYQNSTKSRTTTSITSITSRVDAPLTLDTVLLGLQYNFG